jgi:iron(II)-dependent oxidoreductase
MGDGGDAGPSSGRKRRFPWGDDEPTPTHASLDFRSGDTIDVRALPAGDSPVGCRQMIGNVWEWVDDTFTAYPGFVCDPYREYSEPYFGKKKVLRGGCWATRSRLIRSTWRNFYLRHRRNIFAGFRTVESLAFPTRRFSLSPDTRRMNGILLSQRESTLVAR